MFKSFFELSFIPVTIGCLLLGLLYRVILDDSQWFSGLCYGNRNHIWGMKLLGDPYSVFQEKKKKSNKPEYRETIRDFVQRYYNCTEFWKEIMDVLGIAILFFVYLVTQYLYFHELLIFHSVIISSISYLVNNCLLSTIYISGMLWRIQRGKLCF